MATDILTLVTGSHLAVPWIWQSMLQLLMGFHHKEKKTVNSCFCLFFLMVKQKYIEIGLQHLTPVLQIVVGQIQLHNMGTEGSNLTLVSGPADPTATQHKHAGQVQSVWR